MVVAPLDDGTLVARALRGDDHAYGELVRRHQRIAERVAYVSGASPSELEDVVQEAFVKAHRALRRFRRGAAFRPWLLAIVANEARNARRAAGRREGLALRALASTGGQAVAEADEMVLDGERRDELLAALRQIEPTAREILACRYLLELSEEETASALGIRRGTVKSRTHRALEQLRAAIGEGALR